MAVVERTTNARLAYPVSAFVGAMPAVAIAVVAHVSRSAPVGALIVALTLALGLVCLREEDKERLSRLPVVVVAVVIGACSFVLAFLAAAVFSAAIA